MSNYVISKIDSFSQEKASTGSVLWVLHADKVPPHIGLSVNGLFYSLKANGKDTAAPISSLLEVINRRGITTLCFNLKDDLPLDVINGVFNDYEKTIPNQITCLNPIKELLNQNGASKLIELLASLEESRRINSVTGLNIPLEFSGIKDYDVSDIHARLTLLNKKS